MAIEKYGHFDSTEDDERLLTAASWAKYVSMFLGTGIRNGGTNLQVTSPHEGMAIRVSEGIANINGYGYWVEKNHVEDTPYIELEVPEAHPSKPRIDRVVVRLDLRIAERKITSEIKIGEASHSPVAPELERNNNIYEISLAKVKVPSGALSIAPENITDERLSSEVCGIINSLISADTEEMYHDFQAKFTALLEIFKGDFTGLEETFYEALVLQQSEWSEWFAIAQADPANYFQRNFDNPAMYVGCSLWRFINDNDNEIHEIRAGKDRTGALVAKREIRKKEDKTVEIEWAFYELHENMEQGKWIDGFIEYYEEMEDGSKRNYVERVKEVVK